MWATRFGLFLEILGAILLAAHIVGQHRLHGWEQKVRDMLPYFSKPLSYLHNPKLQGYLLLYIMFIGVVISTIIAATTIIVYHDLIMRLWSGWILLVTIPLILLVGFLFSYMVSALISVAIYFAMIPIRYGFVIQERMNMPGGLRLFGLVFIIAGFILQFYGTF